MIKIANAEFWVHDQNMPGQPSGPGAQPGTEDRNAPGYM